MARKKGSYAKGRLGEGLFKLLKGKSEVGNLVQSGKAASGWGGIDIT